MKLRNKKTGEVKEVIVGGYPVSGKTKMWECSEMDCNEESGYKSLGTYISLAELNAEWEDAPEEPKEYWAIDCFSPDCELVSQFGKCSKRIIENRKQIGNYFETEEEAKKAVESLCAWKRLKDKGFKFTEFNFPKLDHDQATLNIYAEVKNECIYEDLVTLFGGEE